ncbi:MAG TPA: outer membrane lipoprotein chaperone LolA [Thermoanaerobaculia bacterium]|nr:outer membrane lipoprotein chaperone LolA [Thermoanaerobaculia bacterium]
MTRITLIAAGLFMAALPVLAQQAAIDRTAAAMTGMEAKFTHQFTPKGFKTSQTERGSVVFGRLPMMRWTYTAPEAKTFVFDGERSWFYVPADRQVTVADLDERRKGELPFLLIGDPAARARQFEVREQRRGGKITTTLQPRGSASAIRTATIVTDTKSNLIESIAYTDRDGNRTSFAFSGYHRARTGDDTFRFTAPAGVQVVRAD